MSAPIYVCIPTSLRENQDVLVYIQGAFINLCKTYFDVATPIICESKTEAVEVYAMSDVKRGVSSEVALQAIRDGFASIDVSQNRLKVRINYSSLYKDFKPELLDFNKKKTETKKDIPQEFNYENLAKAYVPVDPHFTFEQVVLSDKTKTSIMEAVLILEHEKTLFNDWGLRNIVPNAQSVLNFYGPSGTGKTMAAEALASYLGKKILKSSYADIESKYVGEGPKMLKAIFHAAKQNDALLFIDEADSLLSKRLLNVSDGSAQALNSMRSQLLLCLDSFKGVAVFATNLISNYDDAFLSRMINVEFTIPEAPERELIWRKHLCEGSVNVPLALEVDLKAIAEKYTFVGRDIRNAVKKAALYALADGRDKLDQADLIRACESVNTSNDALSKAKN